MSDTGLITRMLVRSRQGDREALGALFPLVHEELSRIARYQLRRYQPGETLQTGVLVHDAYHRLVDQTQATWQDRAHFFSTAARAMRFILVDHARQRAAPEAGGPRSLARLDDPDLPVEERAGILLALDAALTRMEAIDEQLCRLVECRFFAGLSEAETAEALGLSERTVRRDWMKAKAWIYVELAS
jgi:RNA polymerase sigma factor (TIGR02999 family)